MAGNKFATMLHRNSHKLTVILVYAVLEWILIILLLLNSFFLYLITKFANYFGLKPPCLWCSRVDHVLEPGKSSSSYRDLLCETHATEISKLGYCSNHRKLAEAQNMCTECLASRPSHNHDSLAMSTRIAFFSWVDKDAVENGCKILNCSCCKQSLNNDLCPPFLLFKHSWKALKYNAKKGSLIIEALDDDDSGSECKLVSKAHSFAEIERNGEEHQLLSDVGSFGLKDSIEEECSGSESNLLCYDKEANEDQKKDELCIKDDESCGLLNCVHPSFARDIGEDCLVEFINLHFEKSFVCEANRLIPIKVLDASTFVLEKEDLGKECHQDDTDSSLLTETEVNVSGDEKNTTKEKNMDDDQKSFILQTDDFVSEACENVNSSQSAQFLSTNVKNNEIADAEEPGDLQVQEEEVDDLNLLDNQIQLEPFANQSDQAGNQPQEQESTPLPSQQENYSSINNNGAEIPNSSETCVVENEVGTNYREKLTVEEKSISAEAEEEKFPETPTSVDSFHYLHKKSMLFEKRESGVEESLDGSVVSETDSGDPVLTAEKLRTALKAERKALHALYAELEEERSASAIAANQTMAMINRLQEEKAAMQMEALQYQRMMEEQSEYDQEALQLLNELMIKREREKQELEKELEVYRKKVLDYEAKEKVRMISRSKYGSIRSRNSSATCSNSEDIDELSIDLNREARDEEDGSIYGNQDNGNNNTRSDEINLEEIALDCVKQISTLDDSLAEFEEERLSILDQLKALEERLFSLHDNELEEDEKSVKHSQKYSVKGFDESYELSTLEENDISHTLFKEKRHAERKTVSSMAKSLLPLLDAADNETEDGLIFEENVASEFDETGHISVPKLELDSKKVLEEEVDHVYERLQALEADREFLKHCMSSIKKGDKGMDLLQEILQHLRDLRAVELRVRNMSDDPLG